MCPSCDIITRSELEKIAKDADIIELVERAITAAKTIEIGFCKEV
jgi:hypothetical protein